MKILQHYIFSMLTLTLCLYLLTPNHSNAQVLVRDAEIEHISRQIAAPLFEAANLDGNFVEIHLVLDNQINAFVAKGQRIFLNTGLILAANTPLQLMSVIAHELGHIESGHIARTQEALRAANAQAIAAFILGAAVIAGGGDGGPAVILGGQQLAKRSILKYSRTQETAADLAAIRLLQNSGYSTRGLIEFLELINSQELLMKPEKNPYLNTHPNFPERISNLLNSTKESGDKTVSDLSDMNEAFSRMQAKIFGFVKSSSQVLRKYPESNTSIAARYARTVSYYNEGRLKDSLAEINSLLLSSPEDPYFLELQGQILLGYGKISESIIAYQKASDVLPNEPLMLGGLAAAQIASENPLLLKKAIANLKVALSRDQKYYEGWRQLAVAEGRLGNIGLSALASAEQHMISAEYANALRFSKQATRLLPRGSPGWIRAQDIENTIMILRTN